MREVRARVGVQDASHFQRDFQRRYGLPPSLYRASALAERAAQAAALLAERGVPAP